MKPLQLSERYVELKLTRMQLPGDLPIASQQMIEILKALSYDPDILILDEPTATF